ncbi:hypothetical protein SAMN04487996_109297 [Dyadobacter soli]|uniref:Uncharacterized protein n=1 Tax=Dyadobacter soli TaxID=659014 RepID=A0A1G7JI33_9BACT|nr:hypothetical protein [Dyadobacter soli]SDF24525.1 hypothetical protein SAMN04487996_109297 [Dyadobacter soli]
MDNHFGIQAHLLECGIIGFEPILAQIHKDFGKDDPEIGDWPSVLLATTVLTTAVSLLKLLPPSEPDRHAIDRRSIATIIRNIVDTHDVIDQFCHDDGSETFHLNRDILGYYLANRKMLISERLEMQEGQSLTSIKEYYWSRIKGSNLDKTAINKLKNGETIFYESRHQRIQKICGDQTNLVQGILADLSTYVHSIPPGLWFNSLDESFGDNTQNRNIVAVWLRVGNFYFAKSIEILISELPMQINEELRKFLDNNKKVFD